MFIKIKDSDKKRYNLIEYYLKSFPKEILSELKSLKLIKVTDNERFGHAQYHNSGYITISSSYNIWYFIELLGHEISHALDFDEPHMNCDYFSKWMLYGNGPLKKELDKKYGARSKIKLFFLHRKIKQYVKYEGEKWEKSGLEDYTIKRFYQKNKRFL